MNLGITNLSIPLNSMTEGWNRKIKGSETDFTLALPKTLVAEIFSWMTLHELANISPVSKNWNESANQLVVKKRVISRTVAFSYSDLIGRDSTQEFYTLPDNIIEILKKSCYFFPGKKIIETHFLVGMPENFTIRKLGGVAKEYFPLNDKGYRHISQDVLDELGDKPISKFYWVLVLKSLFNESLGKDYETQQSLANSLAGRTSLPYRISTTVETIACFIAYYIRSRKSLLDFAGFCPLTQYVRCQEKVKNTQTTVGHIDTEGLCIIRNQYNIVDIGIGILPILEINKI